MSKEKILVTGGAGFVGSHLCERLAKNSNYDVYSLDNYFTGSQDNHVRNVTYIEGDVADIESLISFSPSIIYHLGEYSRVEQSFEDIEKVWSYNNNGIFSILEFVRKNGCKIVYAGSSTKFGDDGAGKNSSPYAWTKSSNTQLVLNYGNWFNINFAITYFYNVYGKREISEGKYATLIALFASKMRAGKALSVVSPGVQERNFTHVDDIVDGIVLVGEKGVGDGYGIGSPETFTILDTAKIFGGKIEMLPERKGNRMNAEVVTEKTRSLGWYPKKHLTEYVTNLKKNNWQN